MKKFFTLLSLLLMTLGAVQTNAQLLDRSGWTITASSEGTETATSGFATTIIDGDISTYWHSYWNGMSNAKGYLTPMVPQFFTIDMGSTQTFKTIGYIPRPYVNNAPGNGTAYTWKLYVSDEAFATTDSETSPATIVDALGDPQMSGTWSYDSYDPTSQIQTATNETELSGRYVMFVITSAKGDNFGSCAEFFLSKDDTMSYPFYPYGTSQIEGTKYLDLGEGTPATDLSTDGQWYALYNHKRGAYVHEEQTKLMMRSPSTAALQGAKAADKLGYLFKLISADNGTYKFLSANGVSFSIAGSSSSVVSPLLDYSNLKTFNVQQIGDNAGHFYIQETDNNVVADGNGAGYGFVGWGTSVPTSSGGNNCYHFIPVTLSDVPLNYLITPANDKVYTVSTADRGSWMYDASVSENLLTYTQRNSTAVDATNANQQFAFITSTKGNLYVYNVGAKKFLSTNSVGVNLTTAPQTSGATMINNEENNVSYPYVVAIDGHHLGISSWYTSVNGYTNAEGVISFYNDLEDGGNQVRITEVEDVEFDAAVALARADLFDAIDAYPLGTTYGTYISTEAYTTALAAAQAALSNADATAAELSSAQSAVTTAAAGLVLNLPADGAFLRIKGHNTAGAYLAGENTTTDGKTTRGAFSTATDATTILYYKDGYLLSYGSGLYLCNNSNFAGYNGVQTAGTAITFAKNANVTATGAGAYYVNFAGNSNATRHLYAHNDNYTDAGGGTPNDIRYTFDLEAVESLPVTISAAGYATLYAPVALTVPEGVTAYLVEMQDEKAILNEAGSVIPANTGVVIAGEAGTYNFDITTTDETATSALTGSVPSVNKSVGTYILANKSKGVGFYAINNESDVTVHGFRAFYEDTDAHVAAYLFGGDTTGINAVDSLSNGTNAPMYDLSGRRVAKATKGIYILNGKKVLVK